MYVSSLWYSIRCFGHPKTVTIHANVEGFVLPAYIFTECKCSVCATLEWDVYDSFYHIWLFHRCQPVLTARVVLYSGCDILIIYYRDEGCVVRKALIMKLCWTSVHGVTLLFLMSFISCYGALHFTLWCLFFFHLWCDTQILHTSHRTKNVYISKPYYSYACSRRREGHVLCTHCGLSSFAFHFFLFLQCTAETTQCCCHFCAYFIVFECVTSSYTCCTAMEGALQTWLLFCNLIFVLLWPYCCCYRVTGMQEQNRQCNAAE